MKMNKNSYLKSKLIVQKNRITFFSLKIKYFFKNLIFFCLLIAFIINKIKKKNIGVVGLKHHNNIGNNLVKFSMSIKLKEFGFNPIIIGFSSQDDIYFLKKYVNLKEIKQFLELKKKDYDILMVNSDQTWNGDEENRIDELLNVGYLKFAENWTIPRFVYGASLGDNYWKFSKKFEMIAKQLLKKFSGVSVREEGAIEIIKKHLGINPEFVLDPTFIIDKIYYLDLIKDFKPDLNYNNNYLCIYQLDKNIEIEKLIRHASQLFNYTTYIIDLNKQKYIENFIFCINNSNAVITDSFHGTIFSLIFKKPFIAYLNIGRGSGRFISLIKIFNLSKRIIYPKKFKKVDINLLRQPLNINQSLLNYLKNKSINYLKKNLNIK